MSITERTETDEYTKFTWTEEITGELEERLNDLIIHLIYKGYISVHTEYKITKDELKEALCDYFRKKKLERDETIKNRLNAIYGVDSKEEK